MNHYKKETIMAGVGIARYLEDQGVRVVGNRAVASWRGGDGLSVSIDEDKHLWHDFKGDEGGTVIDLCIKLEGLAFFAACRTLGDRYQLVPDKVSKKPKTLSRGEMLVRDGYKMTNSYEYQNADGTPRYWVDRYERMVTDAEGKPKKEKEFVQRGPNAENLKGIEHTIYHLPAVIAADTVYVAEGEKDADTLTRLGLTATTNSGGAKNWLPSFVDHFEGKDVVMLLDNDDKGQEHGRVVGGMLAGVAKSLKILTPSKLPKGDVTDWIEQEGGTLADLIEIVKAAPTPTTCAPEVAAAKLANDTPLVNYTEEEYTVTDASGKEKTKTRRLPRRVDDICDEMATRFLGFPKVVGGFLFDYTRTSPRKILTFFDQDALRAWVNGTSRNQSDFQSGGPFAGWKEVAARLVQTRPAYDVIAHAPWWPVRDDAFAAYEPLPSADASHTRFNELVDFFLPATDADKTLIRAFLMSPMFNSDGPRPGWVIDTIDAQGSGKTTVVKAAGWLYNEIISKFDLKNVDFDSTKIKRELLSTTGRESRIVLFDNITGAMKSQTLADFITSQYITGMAPYAHGMQRRKNDITWTATVNGASVDTDMAVRSYVIHVKSPGEDRDPMWEKKLVAFIEANRAQIHADIIDLLRTAKARTRKGSRFGEFDAVVLSAACATDAEFEAADAAIRAASESANDDIDLAAQCVEAIADALTSYADSGIRDDLTCVLKCSDVDAILRRTQGGVHNWTSKTVRKFVNGGHIPNIVKGVERIQTADGKRMIGEVRCFVFAGNPELVKGGKPTEAQFVAFANGVPAVVGTGRI